MKEIFAIFGKRPIPGFAKTRLAQDVGEEKATKLYHLLVQEFFRRLKKSLKLELHIFGAPKDEKTKVYFENLVPHKFHFQSELPFFERLKEVFDSFEDTFIHLTGTDIPDFPFEILQEVKLGRREVFIGPDHDGGYYYLGAHSSNSEIFSIDPDQNVFDATVSQAKRLGLSVTILKEWSDIDILCDLERYIARNSSEKISPTLKDLLP